MIGYSNRTVGLSASQSASINATIQTTAPMLDAALPGIGTAIASIAPIITSFFGDKPCNPDEAPECHFRLNWDGSGSITAPSDCCQPPISGTSVFLSEHAPGYKKWPGHWGNAHAGDYFSVGCGPQYAGKHTPGAIKQAFPNYHPMDKGYAPCVGFEPDRISGMIVPDGFAVQIFDEEGFGGDSMELGPGAHNLHELEWGDRIGSMKVRGPFTIWDFFAGYNLKEKKPGWVTADFDHVPTDEEVLQLVMQDPIRAQYLHMDFSRPIIPYASFWSPGWEQRAAQLQQGQVQQAAQQMQRFEQQQFQQQQQLQQPPRRRRSRRSRRQDRRHGRGRSRSWSQRLESQ